MLFARVCLAMSLLVAGCVGVDRDSEMSPLTGAGETPSIRNRFPEERGGFGPSAADEPGPTRQPLL